MNDIKHETIVMTEKKSTTGVGQSFWSLLWLSQSGRFILEQTNAINDDNIMDTRIMPWNNELDVVLSSELSTASTVNPFDEILLVPAALPLRKFGGSFGRIEVLDWVEDSLRRNFDELLICPFGQLLVYANFGLISVCLWYVCDWLLVMCILDNYCESN